MSTDEINRGLDLNKPGPTLFVLWGVSPAILMLVSGLLSLELEGFFPMAISALATPVILFPWCFKLLKHASVNKFVKILLALMLTVVFTGVNVMLGVGGCTLVASMISAIVNAR